MRFSITYKLLLSFFVATVVAVGSMAVLTKWSFERGFLQYINTVETPLNALDTADLVPGAAALEKLNASLR